MVADFHDVTENFISNLVKYLGYSIRTKLWVWLSKLVATRQLYITDIPPGRRV